ncbi:hypothetical protein F5Y14DRAFT_334495 [Nemania sp. NC0429]|nr:hypothetical protein F5Y14DRAFT_334495 [Nemania sp. NC0429]
MGRKKEKIFHPFETLSSSSLFHSAFLSLSLSLPVRFIIRFCGGSLVGQTLLPVCSSLPRPVLPYPIRSYPGLFLRRRRNKDANRYEPTRQRQPMQPTHGMGRWMQAGLGFEIGSDEGRRVSSHHSPYIIPIHIHFDLIPLYAIISTRKFFSVPHPNPLPLFSPIHQSRVSVSGV